MTSPGGGRLPLGPAPDTRGPGRTTTAIAHRLPVLRAADVFCSLVPWRVAERGTYAGLLARRGRYAALCTRQYGDSPVGARRRDGLRLADGRTLRSASSAPDPAAA